jgi:NAD-dependent dihydropyrimidine dehydrogenase PreA subunit
MNDKCAGGTGRFLEMIAEVLNLPLTKIGEVSLESKTAVPFNTICAVFAKTDAINNIRKGVAKSDILAGLHDAIASRCLNLLKRVTIQKDFSISGGISKNKGMVAKIKEKIGLEPLLSEDPQIIGALGAALFAEERLKGVEIAGMKVNYGYSDGTGDYFITIDTSTCDGCAECVKVCPSGLYVIASDEGGKPRAAIKEDLRKKIAIKCPGLKNCGQAQNCHTVCAKNAITHSW